MTSVLPDDTMPITLVVNGTEHRLHVAPRRMLVDVVREDLGLTGTHAGCEHGVCGACTLVVDGQTVRSCLLLAVQADGGTITTIEGLAEGDELSPLQQAFRDRHGFQCGFCAPGFLLTAKQLVDEGGPPPDRDTLRAELAGNLCRCTGYHSILDAVAHAVAAARDTEESS